MRPLVNQRDVAEGRVGHVNETKYPDNDTCHDGKGMVSNKKIHLLPLLLTNMPRKYKIFCTFAMSDMNFLN